MHLLRKRCKVYNTTAPPAVCSWMMTSTNLLDNIYSQGLLFTTTVNEMDIHIIMTW
jgi:hypothetical protein